MSQELKPANNDIQASLLEKLTSKRRKFALEYVKCHNGKEAAIRAGYNPHSAAREAHRLKRNPIIQAFIASFVNEDVADMETVIARYHEIAFGIEPDGKAWKGSDVKGALDSLAKIKGLFLNKEQSPLNFQPVVNITLESDDDMKEIDGEVS